MLKDSNTFRAQCNRAQRMLNTLDGVAADTEERLDLRLGKAIKALLELEVGSEEGPNPVHGQN